MTKNLILPVLCGLLLVASCKKEQKIATDPLHAILNSSSPKITRVMNNVAAHEVQIRFTQIDRQADSIGFTDYDFQVDDSVYFYPASTVKFPIAVLALQKLNKIDSLDRNTRFYIEGDSVETTIAEAISQIFTVSDNLANNRLVEFLGQDAINRGLFEKGVRPVRIAHRLGYRSDDTATKPLIIYLNDSTTATFEGTVNTAAKPLALKSIKKGVAFQEGDSTIQEPFDFSLKNYYPVSAQHGLLKRIIFPEAFAPDERFEISDNQRQFLLTAMHTLPKKLGYDSEKYHDGYCKFIMFGDSKEDIPDHIKIYNKVGWAYGTLTDCAYVLDTKNSIEFMVTASLLVNKNQIFNDNKYEFEETGIPFLAELGRQLYQSELSRKHK